MESISIVAAFSSSSHQFFTTATPHTRRSSLLFSSSSSSSSPLSLSNSLSFTNTHKYNSHLNLSISSTSSVSAAASVQNDNLVGDHDLLIVGPGVLGRILADKWRQEHQGCQVYGQTLTTDHHQELFNLGINPVLQGTTFANPFPFVICCAPPSKSPDYPADLRSATLNWNGQGSFLFTSTSGLFDCNDNGSCNEDTPVAPVGKSPRTDILLKAEQVVLEAGADRGAHTYWLRKGTLDSRPDHLINLIHYEDAASLSITILKKKLRSQIFLGCDNHPLSRQEIMDLVQKSGKFSGTFEGFTGTDGPLGKRLDNTKTRKELGWEPKYPSFAQFLGLFE
ncbi:hypothetical protein ACFE04_005430 [Oxalis oulophora]